ncbi:Galactose-specific lectin nattectin [Collichthys lucidus]|uniref:Galactose-specific lectin nattectin n=1 Tax=Collichthys lucidus TaxID=240159 RepID=A0A4U5V278_COLLU|nr:Galactose-specific lectin nattectin [Collichthys lucidus]
MNTSYQSCSRTKWVLFGDSATETPCSVHAALLAGLSTLHVASSCPTNQRSGKMLKCLDYGGDLAMVWNKEDQTFQYVQQNPSEDFHSAWIGLQDMVKEGTFFWVNGDTIKWNVIYWMDQEPNNAMAAWDTSQAGQDCVAIVPPTHNWDDIIKADGTTFVRPQLSFWAD